MGNQQAVTLGADITQLDNDVLPDLSLKSQVVLFRVLGPHMGLEVAEEQDRAERGPIDRSPRQADSKCR